MMRGAIEKLRRLVHDEHRKPFAQIAREALQWSIKYNELPQVYFGCLLFRADAAGGLGSYLSGTERERIKSYSGERSNVAFLHDKLLFQHHFGAEESIPLPAYMGYNVGPRFFREGRRESSREERAPSSSTGGGRSVETPKALAELVTSLTRAHDCDAVFVKPIAGGMGTDIFKLSEATAPEALATAHRRITAKACLFQEALVQQSEVSRLYPHSINTLRVVSCKRKGEKAKVACALLRLGGGATTWTTSRKAVCTSVSTWRPTVFRGRGASI